MAAKVPVVRLSAWPVPLSTRSGDVVLPAVSVPKPLPKIFAPVVLPTVKPRRVMPPALTVRAFVAAIAVVIVTLLGVPLVTGSGSL